MEAYQVSTAEPLLIEDGIKYVLLTEAHKEETIRIATDAFAEGEPLTQLLGIKREGWEGMNKLYWSQFCDNGLSVVGIDEASGKVIGTFLGCDPTPKMGCCAGISFICSLISWWHKNKEFEPMIAIIEDLKKPINTEHSEIQKKYKVPQHGCIVEMTSVAVHKDFGRRGIGGKLTKLFVENCKKQGFWIAIAECSSSFSTRALEKQGGKNENSIDYKTYKFKDRKPFEAATEPHDKINLVVFRLKDEI